MMRFRLSNSAMLSESGSNPHSDPCLSVAASPHAAYQTRLAVTVVIPKGLSLIKSFVIGAGDGVKGSLSGLGVLYRDSLHRGAVDFRYIVGQGEALSAISDRTHSARLPPVSTSTVWSGLVTSNKP